MLKRFQRHFLLPFALACSALAQDAFFLKPNDTVVFYGDSITDQRLYTTFVETYVVTRFPQLPVRFVHSGWGGDRVTGGGGGTIEERLKRDVIAYKPTVMTIMLGMNDGRYRPFDASIFETYSSGYENIVKTMKDAAPGLRFTLIQPSPFDDVTRPATMPGGYNATLLRYSDFVKELAQKNGQMVADLNAPVVEMLNKANASDPTNALKIVPDRVHPGASGHLIMAAALLKAWGAPALVTAVHIDAASKSVKSAGNTSVSGFDGLTWTQKDSALPMPVNMADPATALAVKSSDFVESLNRQTLKVTGLEGGTYTLKINGAVAGKFSEGQLSEGVNLAALPTPMLKQAEGVHALTLKRTGVHNMRWRQLQTVFAQDGIARVQTIMENLDALDEELAARQRSAAQPSSCYYELARE